MNTDSSVNVVLFEVLIGRRLEKLFGEGATRAADCIRTVWEEVATDFGARSADVRRVYSQWEPTPGDRTFLAAEFPPTVLLSFSFRRPATRREWGKWTPEFDCVVGGFEQRRFSTGLEKAGQRRGRSQPPWWQYWEVKNGHDGQPKRCRNRSRPPWWQYWD
jgi:hypothetical protein